jgi:hypothetical protein
LLATTSSDRVKLLAHIRSREAESVVQIVNHILNLLKRRGSSILGARVVEELFPSVEMDSISKIRSAFDMLRSLGVSDEVRKPCIDTMRKRLCQLSVDSVADWIDGVTLFKSLGGNWTFDEKGSLVRILSRPGVSWDDCEEIKKALMTLNGRVAWLDISRAVLKNGHVKLSPGGYVERAKALSGGNADQLGKMMQWFVELADWKRGFANESERDAFFAKYGLKLPVEKGSGAHAPKASGGPKSIGGKKKPDVRLTTKSKGGKKT